MCGLHSWSIKKNGRLLNWPFYVRMSPQGILYPSPYKRLRSSVSVGIHTYFHLDDQQEWWSLLNGLSFQLQSRSSVPCSLRASQCLWGCRAGRPFAGNSPTSTPMPCDQITWLCAGVALLWRSNRRARSNLSRLQLSSLWCCGGLSIHRAEAHK